MNKLVLVLVFVVYCSIDRPIIDAAAVAIDHRDILVGDLFGTDEELTRGFDRVGDKFLGILETIVSDDGRTGRSTTVEGRKKKYKKKLNKYVLPLLVGFLLIKSVLLPIILKTLAVLSGKAVVLSLMSLILAAIVGLRSIATGFTHKIDHYAKYRRKDWPEPVDQPEEDPYHRYPYADRTRRRRRR